MSEPPVELAKFSSSEAAEVLARRPGIVIPVGSLEQHGPNLALITDAAIAEALALRLAARYPGPIVVTPTVSTGVSSQHRSFAGTVALSPGTLQAIIRDIVGSLARYGPTRFLLINGHGGNHATLESLCQALESEGVVKVALSTWFRTVADVIAQRWPQVRVHGSEVETSVALELAPWLVKRDALSAGAERPYPYRQTDPLAGGRVFYPYRWEEMTANGVFGDARRATAAFGREVVETAIARLLEFMEDFFARE